MSLLVRLSPDPRFWSTILLEWGRTFISETSACKTSSHTYTQRLTSRQQFACSLETFPPRCSCLLLWTSGWWTQPLWCHTSGLPSPAVTPRGHEPKSVPAWFLLSVHTGSTLFGCWRLVTNGYTGPGCLGKPLKTTLSCKSTILNRLKLVTLCITSLYVSTAVSCGRPFRAKLTNVTSWLVCMMRNEGSWGQTFPSTSTAPEVRFQTRKPSSITPT